MKPHEYVILEVARERERQMSAEGWSTEHDNYEHSDGALGLAAACYASPIQLFTKHDRRSQVVFQEQHPFGHEYMTRKHQDDRRRQLVIAAALIVAEIERLDRSGSRANAVVAATS